MQQIDALLSTYHSIVRLHTLHIAIHSLAAKYKRGFLDVCKLRNHATNELWRQYAVTVGVIFFIRYCLQISDYVKLTKTENGVASKTDYWVRFFQIFSAKLVLEVFGGAGAVWGFSEVLTLRNSVTQELWRFNSLAMGCIMFVRFLMQMKEYSVNHSTRKR